MSGDTFRRDQGGDHQEIEVRGIGQVAKLRDARAEMRLTRALGSGKARRRQCGRERGVEVTVREQQGRRMKHECGEGESEICDMHTQQTFFTDT